MPPFVKIKVSGLKNTTAFLLNEAIRKGKETKKGIARATIFLQGEVKKSIAGQAAEPQSVDTGRFLNSVEVNIEEDNGTVFSNLPYARILEEGGSKRVSRNHFKNSSSRSKNRIRDIIAAEIK